MAGNLGLRACARALGMKHHQTLLYHVHKGHVQQNADGTFDLERTRQDLRRNAPNSAAEQASGAPELTLTSDIALNVHTFADARTEREYLRLERERLDIEERRGKLVSVAEVRAAQTERATAEREAFLNWPGRIAAGLAARLGCMERDVFAELDAEVRKFLEERSRTPVPQTEMEGD